MSKLEKPVVEAQASWSSYLERGRRELKKKKHKHKHKDYGIEEKTVHGLMIDAGSTGSRIHVYEFHPRVLTKHHKVEQAVSGHLLSYPGTNSRWTARLKPGLEAFAARTDNKAELLQLIAEYLAPLMDFAKEVLFKKQEQWNEFPIYLRATGGVRTLTPADRSRVMKSVRTLFANNTYCPFGFESIRARVVSGEEEAIFGWAGVNFVMGNLLPDSRGSGTVISPRLTYGALDMGGASTQVRRDCCNLLSFSLLFMKVLSQPTSNFCGRLYVPQFIIFSQISFYDPNEDVMSNLFKLQIGQGKHWNVYAHSFLYYGVNEARNRFEASLLAQNNATNPELEFVYNPCLPGNSTKEVHTRIHLDANGIETWNFPAQDGRSGDFAAILQNPNPAGDFDQCQIQVRKLLHKAQNAWCAFEHRDSCSYVGVYQPDLPKQKSQTFGEFMAFSNYFHVWEFLQLDDERTSLQQLYDRARYACTMSRDQVEQFNGGIVDDDELNDYCFKSVYVFELLFSGYGFQMGEFVTFSEVVNGQKVGWPLGAMLYEVRASSNVIGEDLLVLLFGTVSNNVPPFGRLQINTLPWIYDVRKCHHKKHHLDLLGEGSPGEGSQSVISTQSWLVIILFMGLATFEWRRIRSVARDRREYEPLDSTRT